MSIVMGTAGHIDHGKTTLIKALTGIDCDRLKDEKKRGITIELGFAYLDLPNGTRLSIVDVPGHEKFVKNMVAGATGIDFVLLVVAADEGIMPQTREHIEICSLLGINKGVVALTKIDMVDEELRELAMEDVSDYLSNTFLKDAKIVPVSAHTGEGLKELTHAIEEIVDKVKQRSTSDIFVLPVDRVFTLKGHGTVVTGTLVSGKVSIGEDVFIYPYKKVSKVRNIQVHGESVKDVSAGRRTAINLAQVEVEDIERGNIIARPDTLFPSNTFDVEITCLSSSPRPILHRKEVHFHHGTTEIMARIYLLDRDKLQPGETGYAQIRFPEPMVGLCGDKFVVRSFSPLRTIGGGTIINPIGQKIKRFSKQVDVLKKLIKADTKEKIILHLEQIGFRGYSLKELHVLTNAALKQLQKELEKLQSRQEVFCFDKEEKIYIGRVWILKLQDSLVSYIKEFHAKNPIEPGISKGQIISDWGKDLNQKLVHFVLEYSFKQGLIESEGELIKIKGYTVSLKQDQEKIKKQILEIFKRSKYKPPTVKNLVEQLGLEKKVIDPILKLLTDKGELVKIKEDIFYPKDIIEDIKTKLLKFFEQNEEMKPQHFKELTGLSRKYSIPLLEYFDKEKLTMRIGDVRKLRKR